MNHSKQFVSEFSNTLNMYKYCRKFMGIAKFKDKNSYIRLLFQNYDTINISENYLVLQLYILEDWNKFIKFFLTLNLSKLSFFDSIILYIIMFF